MVSDSGPVGPGFDSRRHLKTHRVHAEDVLVKSVGPNVPWAVIAVPMGAVSGEFPSPSETVQNCGGGGGAAIYRWYA